jgi:hypothetical protein
LYELRTPERLTDARAGSALLGTPTTARTVRSERFRGKNPNMWELAKMLPTPVVNDMGAGKSVEWWDTWTAKIGGHGDSLSIEMQRLLPTPTANNAKESGTQRDWRNVDWQLRLSNHASHTASVLMNLRLNDGSEPSDGQLLTQLTIEGCDPDSSSG